MKNAAAGATSDSQQFEALKAQMRLRANEYASGLPAADMANLLLGLDSFLENVPKIRFLPLGERDGAYDPTHNLILIDSNASQQRQRFTLAHEISHALLLHDEDLLSDLHDLFEGGRLEQAIETLCNVGAAEILMPTSRVEEMLQRFGTTARALAELARRSDVSATAAMYALAERSPLAVMYAIYAPEKNQGQGKNNGNGSKDTQLVVRSSAGSKTFPYSLTSGTPLPLQHPLMQTYFTELANDGPSTLPFRSGKQLPAYVSGHKQGGLLLAAFTLETEQLRRIQQHQQQQA